MKKQNNKFLELVDKAMQDPNLKQIRTVVEKELLHYDILFVLDKYGFLNKLTFQGGTCLRLCYGSLRFSEDLDFAGGFNFDVTDIIQIKNHLENYLTEKYGLQVMVKEPQFLRLESNPKNINVVKWQIQVVTHPEPKDLPQQKIKLEVANIPAYTKEPRQFINHYNFLPDGYGDLIIMAESLDEIFADKIVAFIAAESPVRYRDIWDLHWLQRQGAQLNFKLVKQKILDYSIKDFIAKRNVMMEKLPALVNGKAFLDQMSRFLPTDIVDKTLKNPNFMIILLQLIFEIYNNLGFEIIENNGLFYGTNHLVPLNEIDLEDTIARMNRFKGKDGNLVVLFKVPNQLIVSPDNEDVATQLFSHAQNRSLLKKYKVDNSLNSGAWFIEFAGPTTKSH